MGVILVPIEWFRKDFPYFYSILSASSFYTFPFRFKNSSLVTEDRFICRLITELMNYKDNFLTYHAFMKADISLLKNSLFLLDLRIRSMSEW